VYTITTVNDTTPPVTAIIVGDPQYTSSCRKRYVTSATMFALSATDDLSGVAKTEYRIDNGSWIAYAPFTLASEGSHVIGYRSVDRRNNTETEKKLTVIVDNTPPVSTLSIGSVKCNSGGSISVTKTTKFTITATDASSGVRLSEYRIDGGSWTTYGGAFALAGYSTGAHTISYRSTDNVGNVETAKIKTVKLQ
jgi:hypothetical protein